MLCLNISDIAIITVKGVGYPCIPHGISKFEAIHQLEKCVLDDRGVYIKCMSKKSILKIESTTIHVRCMGWRNRSKQPKVLNKKK